METKQRYISAIEVNDGDAVIVLDDGSTLGGIVSVSATSTVNAPTIATMTVYVMNEITIASEEVGEEIQRH